VILNTHGVSVGEVIVRLNKDHTKQNHTDKQ
jgi:hypothetical protein